MFGETKRKRFLQPDELARLFRAMRSEPNPDLVDYVNLSLWTGCRRSDVLSMRWQDVHLEDNRLDIPDPKAEPYSVPLTPEAIEILKRRLKKRRDDSPWVFPSIGATGHIVDLKKRWKELLKRAEITDLRQHDLRRTQGSWQAAQGTSLQVIGKSLGHASIQATAIYSQLQLDPVRESMAAANKQMGLAMRKRLPGKPEGNSTPRRARKSR
jgi:integrase